MAAPRSTASHASVAYLRIPEFAQRGVAEEAHLKERLEKVVVGALGILRANDYIVVDAPEGLAVVVLANPRGALRFAWRAGADRDIEPAIGIAHGPVRVAHGQPPVLYGDALIAAEGAARATNPGRISVSRDFRDALTRTHPGMRRLLARSGSAVDEQGRAHEIFRADERTVRRRRSAFFMWAALVALGIVFAGTTIRATRPLPVPPPPPPTPAPAPVPEPLPGAVTFEIKPEGEIFVDGVLKGKSPPLKKIQVPPGNHGIEVRNAKFNKPFVTELAVGPGEEFAVTHDFVVKQPPRPVVKTPAKPRPPQPQARPQPQAKSQPQEEKSAWDRFVEWFKGDDRPPK